MTDIPTQSQRFHQLIVIENGSANTRIGFAGELTPREIFPTVISRQSEATTRLKYPVENGVIVNWDDITVLWHQIFYEFLKVEPSQHPVLLLVPPFNPRLNSEKIAEIMFEEFCVPALSLALGPLVALRALEKDTGLVIDIGLDKTDFVPILEGQMIPSDTQRYDAGGRAIQLSLEKLLVAREDIVSSNAKPQIINKIISTLCYVSSDPSNTAYEEKSFDISNGKTITLGKERCLAPEALMQPQIQGKDLPSFSDWIYANISRMKVFLHGGIEYRKDNAQNIVLIGGPAALPGILERLKKDLTKIDESSTSFSPRLECRLSSPKNPASASWVGGAKCAAQEPSRITWVSRQEYDDEGPNVIHRFY